MRSGLRFRGFLTVLAHSETLWVEFLSLRVRVLRTKVLFCFFGAGLDGGRDGVVVGVRDMNFFTIVCVLPSHKGRLRCFNALCDDVDRPENIFGFSIGISVLLPK
jgi:hypothetical protein